MLVLGVEREDGGYLGAPRGEAELHPGDTVLLYGRQKVLASIDARRAGPEGNREHVESVSEQAEVERSEREEDEADSKESKQESGGDSE